MFGKSWRGVLPWGSTLKCRYSGVSDGPAGAWKIRKATYSSMLRPKTCACWWRGEDWLPSPLVSRDWSIHMSANHESSRPSTYLIYRTDVGSLCGPAHNLYIPRIPCYAMIHMCMYLQMYKTSTSRQLPPDMSPLRR